MTGTFEGVSTLQFTPDNKYAQAVSGIVGATNIETTLIEFKTNSEYIKGKIQMTCAISTGHDTRYKIYFNNIIIFQYGMDTSGQYGTEEDPDQPVFVIVPSFTTVKITATNVSTSDSIDQVAIFTGEVHGAIEQENLESITDNNKWASK